MKHKVGDKVKIRKDLDVDKIYGYDAFVENMKAYLGKWVTIAKESDSHVKYYIEEDGGRWAWTDEMFDPNVNAPAVEVPIVTSQQVLDSLSSAITKNKAVDKLTLINQLTDTLINNLDTNTKDMILRYMLLDFFERFIENGN